MSTTKNEQYHILSPEWLRTNPLPDDAEGQSHGGNWFLSDYRGEKLPHHIELIYRTQRTDLPPKAYATPPTDTTGSGREGETPETDAEACPFEDLPSEPSEHSDEIVPADFARQLERQRDAALAQVEALRRDNEDMRENIERLARETGALGTATQIVDAAIDSAQRQEGSKVD